VHYLIYPMAIIAMIGIAFGALGIA